MVDFNSSTLAGGTKESLTYPRDMMGEDFYPEAIRFGIFTRQGPSYSTIKESAKGLADAVTDIGSESTDVTDAKNNREFTSKADIPDEQKQQILDSFDADIRELQGERLKQTTDAALKKGGAVLDTFVEEFKKRKPTLDKTIESHIQSIYLNMPSSVAFNEAVQWQGSDLGVIGALSAGGLGAAAENGLLSNAGAMLGGGIGAAANLLPGVSGLAAPIIGAVVGSGGLQSGIESTFNVKANPYKEQTFEGVDFRTFDFSFVFRARSQGDVNMIQKIITAFRAYSKPTYEGDNGETGVFSYPKEYSIEFLTLDSNDSYQTNSYLPELKMCVCTAVNTNFAGSGWRSFAGGAPVDISLQLTFSETEIITGEDVLGETVAGRFKDTGRKF